MVIALETDCDTMATGSGIHRNRAVIDETNREWYNHGNR